MCIRDRPAPAPEKKLTCTGSQADFTLSLTEGNNQGGSFHVKSKTSGLPTATAHVLLVPVSDHGMPEYVKFEGSSGDYDFYLSIKKADYDRRSGDILVYFHYATGGQQWSASPDHCAF